ncbi:Calx-beta domain protein [compost metagenome]
MIDTSVGLTICKCFRLNILIKIMGCIISLIIQTCIISFLSAKEIIPPRKVALACVSIHDTSVIEGNTGKKTIYFKVTLDVPSADSNRIVYWFEKSTNDVNGAVRPSDYTATLPYDNIAGSVTFQPGETVKYIPVSIVGDPEFEPDQSFNCVISPGQGVIVCKKRGTCTIINDDAPPKLNILDTTVVEGNQGDVKMYFLVKLKGHCTDYPIKFHCATSPGTAISNDDYDAINGTLTLPANKTYKWIVVNVNSDTVKESHEDFFVTISAADHATIGRNTARGVIQDDDNTDSNVRFYVNNIVKEENSGTARFTVGIYSQSSLTVSVDYSTADSSAKAGSDYYNVAGTLAFVPGETIKYIDVPIINDTIFETKELFSLKLTNPVNATIADYSGLCEIPENDPENKPPKLKFFPSAVQFDENKGPYWLNVEMDHRTNRTVTVDFTTENGTAIAGDDYTATSGTLVFKPYEWRKTIIVTMIDDNIEENEEVFSINFSNITNATFDLNEFQPYPYTGGFFSDSVPNVQAVYIIKDNDHLPFPTPKIISKNYSLSEEYGGSFQLTMDAPSTEIVQFDYKLEAGTATEGVDFESSSGTVYFNRGAMTSNAMLQVKVIDDNVVEPPETIIVKLSNPVNATLSDTVFTYTIVDNDGPKPRLYFEVVESEESQKKIVYVRLVGKATSPISVNYSTVNNTAIAGTDYIATSGTIQFESGSSDFFVKSFEIPLINDDVIENRESFFIQFSNPVNVALPLTQLEYYIIDDDPEMGFVINDTTINEGDINGRYIQVNAMLKNPARTPFRFNFKTANGTATRDNDYYETLGLTIMFEYGNSNRLLLIPIKGDTIPEEVETFTIKYWLEDEQEYQARIATITIIDDDSPTITASTDPAPAPISVEAPKKTTNVFTPNGDGINDLFYLEGIENIPNEITVVSKNGRQIYRQTNYKNDWDGAGAPDGTYFYFLKIQGDDGKMQLKKGFITVLRQQSK